MTPEEKEQIDDNDGSILEGGKDYDFLKAQQADARDLTTRGCYVPTTDTGSIRIVGNHQQGSGCVFTHSLGQKRSLNIHKYSLDVEEFIFKLV
jgi:hypothetical protein